MDSKSCNYIFAKGNSQGQYCEAKKKFVAEDGKYYCFKHAKTFEKKGIKMTPLEQPKPKPPEVIQQKPQEAQKAQEFNVSNECPDSLMKDRPPSPDREVIRMGGQEQVLEPEVIQEEPEPAPETHEKPTVDKKHVPANSPNTEAPDPDLNPCPDFKVDNKKIPVLDDVKADLEVQRYYRELPYLEKVLPYRWKDESGRTNQEWLVVIDQTLASMTGQSVIEVGTRAVLVFIEKMGIAKGYKLQGYSQAVLEDEECKKLLKIVTTRNCAFATEMSPETKLIMSLGFVAYQVHTGSITPKPKETETSRPRGPKYKE